MRGRTHCRNGHEYGPTTTAHNTQGRVCLPCLEVRREIRNRALREERRKGREQRGGYVHQGKTPERICDWLLLVGTWDSTDAVAHALGTSMVNARQYLYRLRRQGFVESRTVLLATGTSGHLERRTEWRHLRSHEAWVA